MLLNRHLVDPMLCTALVDPIDNFNFDTDTETLLPSPRQGASFGDQSETTDEASQRKN